MLNKTRIVSVFICVSGLSACTSDSPPVYNYPTYTYDNTQLYPQSYEGGYAELPQEKKQIEVPETYHVGSYHSPTSHTDVDRSWVKSQNGQSYTIELADSDKASQVAGKLYKTPKNQRTAEVKYQRDGKTYYKGLYGTYPSYEAAQQALSALPEDVKQTADIKTWSAVQSGVGE